MNIKWNEYTWYSKLAAAIFFIIILPVWTFYLGTQYQLTQSTLTANQNLVPIQNDEAALFASLKTTFTSLDSKSDIDTSKGTVWWINNEGYSVLIPARESITVNKVMTTPIAQGEVSAVFAKEIAATQKLFKENNFKINAKNSSETTKDLKFYDYVEAYEKGTTICTLTLNPDFLGNPESGSSAFTLMLSVNCANTLQLAEQQQIPYLKALGLQNKDEVVTEQQRSGDFVMVSVHARRTGYAAILKKEGENFRTLFTGQEAPDCELVKKEQIPAEIIGGLGNCYK